MAQSVERRLGKAEVVGSSPISSFEASQMIWDAFYFYLEKRKAS